MPNDWTALNDTQREAVLQVVHALPAGPAEVLEVLRRLPRLSPAQLRRIYELSDAFLAPIAERVARDSTIVGPAFLDEFRSRLQAYHALNTTRLAKGAFEDAFLAASQKENRQTVRAASATNRFWDVKVDNLSLSLKTEGHSNLREDFLHISKLTEAAWLQDMRGARARREHTLELFETYIDQVAGIVVLRSYPGRTIRYELVEIPIELFQPVLELPQQAFASDGPTIRIPYGSTAGNADLVLKLDRSDAKITIGRIRKSRCVVHAEWELGEAPDIDGNGEAG